MISSHNREKDADYKDTMTSADVKYSFERAVNPATQSPGGGYFGMIAGYDDVVGGKATTLSGIETPDQRVSRRDDASSTPIAARSRASPRSGPSTRSSSASARASAIVAGRSPAACSTWAILPGVCSSIWPSTPWRA